MALSWSTSTIPVVLVTVVGRKEAKPGQDFFPLTVDYQERTYAAGKIPGGFFKREGRPSEKETLTSRLIDRPIRPLFPDGFYNEVQVVATVDVVQQRDRFGHPGDDRRVCGAGLVRHSVQTVRSAPPASPISNGAVRAQSDRYGAEDFAAESGGRRYRSRRC